MRNTFVKFIHRHNFQNHDLSVRFYIKTPEKYLSGVMTFDWYCTHKNDKIQILLKLFLFKLCYGVDF